MKKKSLIIFIVFLVFIVTWQINLLSNPWLRISSTHYLHKKTKIEVTAPHGWLIAPYDKTSIELVKFSKGTPRKLQIRALILISKDVKEDLITYAKHQLMNLKVEVPYVESYKDSKISYMENPKCAQIFLTIENPKEPFLLNNYFFLSSKVGVYISIASQEQMREQNTAAAKAIISMMKIPGLNE